MVKKVVPLFLATIACAWSVFGVTNYPFPQQYKFSNGIMPTGALENGHRDVQMVYDIWLKNYYTENGSQARIKFDKNSEKDESGNTVSEGIGYGMLIMVFMENETNKTQEKFDKLWNYYKAHLDGNGLMHWKIQGFTNTILGDGAATDAELDVAVALIMADKQWGGNYLAEAKNLINKIAAHEVSNNMFKGGDQWSARNPSYMSTVATQLFQNINAGSNWGAVQSGCYSLLKKSQAKSSAGLWPNWCDDNGNPGGGVGANTDKCGFDASRTPWRLGWAYVWYGHADAKTMCGNTVTKMTDVIGDNPGACGQMYQLNGQLLPSDDPNNPDKYKSCIPTFLGPFTCAGMADASHSTWLNNGYTRLRSFNAKNDGYYNECLELLTMLLLTGNMVDFTKVEPRTTAKITSSVRPAGAGTVTLSPQKDSYSVDDEVTISTTSANSSRYVFIGWEGDLTGTSASSSFKVGYNRTITAVYRDEQANDLLDDCEDNDGLTNLGTEWFTYTDVLDTGKSTVTPVTKTGETLFKMTSGGYNSSQYAVKISWTLDKGGFKYDPFVGVGFELAPKAAYTDISKSTGISFYYKGTFGSKDTCELKIECGAVTTLGADFAYPLPGSTTWKEVNIKWDEFKQPWWVKGDAIAVLDLKKINKIQWQIHGKTGAASELWIDDVHILGLPIAATSVDMPAISKTPITASIKCIRSGANLTVNYSVGHNGAVSLALYDISGRMVKNLKSGFMNAGNHTSQIDIRDLSNSTYMVRLSTQDGSFTRQLVVNR